MTPASFKHIRPKWFCKKKAFKSFCDALDETPGIDVKVLHDGDGTELLNFIRLQNLPIIPNKCNAKSNYGSLIETFHMADEAFRNGYESVYFVEDDYLHTDWALDTIFKGAETFGLVTGFDHLDRYIRDDDISFGKEHIAFSRKTNCHWRTAESTTCTWACNKDTWYKIREDVYHYGLQDRNLFRALYNKGIRLWTPIPGVSTTLDYTTFSPGVDWEKINANVDISIPNCMEY